MGCLRLGWALLSSLLLIPALYTLLGALMCKHHTKPAVVPTIWQVPDELWGRIAPILAELDPPKPTGRKRVNARPALDAIIFRLRSGCQWNQLPERFPGS